MNLIEDWKRERKIRSTLRALARQRVVMILQPGNVWVFENAPPMNDDTQVVLRTCYMRGWVEPLQGAVPQGTLGPGGTIPPPTSFVPVIYYRLTDSGWAVINRSQQMVILGLFLAFVALLAA